LLGEPHQIDGAAEATKLQWVTEDEFTGGDQVLSWLVLIGLVRVRLCGQAADPG
jgi:hypothetical protein